MRKHGWEIWARPKYGRAVWKKGKDILTDEKVLSYFIPWDEIEDAKYCQELHGEGFL